MTPEKQEVLWENLVELKETPGQGGETPEKRGEPEYPRRMVDQGHVTSPKFAIII